MTINSVGNSPVTYPVMQTRQPDNASWHASQSHDSNFWKSRGKDSVDVQHGSYYLLLLIVVLLFVSMTEAKSRTKISNDLGSSIPNVDVLDHLDHLE